MIDNLTKLEVLKLEFTNEKEFMNKSKLALELYLPVLWATNNSLNDMYDYALEVGEGDMKRANVMFEIFAPDKQKEDFLDNVDKNEYSSLILSSILSAVGQLREYPRYGMDYYTILNDLYISADHLSGESIAEKLNISRTTFYKRKKEALRLFSVCLFGYKIPELKGYLW